MCGPWLILSPFAGLILATVIHGWGGPRKTFDDVWAHIGFFGGVAFMFGWLITLCR